MIWLYFAFIQLVSLIAMLIGIPLLAVACALHAWEPAEQAYIPDWQHQAGLPPKTINIWKWHWLNKVYGNDEDGVTGVSWYNDSQHPSAWRAYLWSAWRNSTNNLRFGFRNIGGPLYRKEYRGWYFQAGWYENGFPVLSAGRIS